MKAEILILGALHRQDMHPYEIKRRLQAAQVECYLDVDVGTLYYAIRQLAKAGHIAVRGQDRVARGGERTIYGLTEAGRARFQELMRERLSNRTPAMHALYPALLFLHLGDQAEIGELLRRRLEILTEGEAELGRSLPKLIAVVATGTRFLIEHGMAHLRLEIDWLNRLLVEVEAGRVRPPDFEQASALGLIPDEDKSS